MLPWDNKPKDVDRCHLEHGLPNNSNRPYSVDDNINCLESVRSALGKEAHFLVDIERCRNWKTRPGMNAQVSSVLLYIAKAIERLREETSYGHPLWLAKEMMDLITEEIRGNMRFSSILCRVCALRIDRIRKAVKRGWNLLRRFFSCIHIERLVNCSDGRSGDGLGIPGFFWGTTGLP